MSYFVVFLLSATLFRLWCFPLCSFHLVRVQSGKEYSQILARVNFEATGYSLNGCVAIVEKANSHSNSWLWLLHQHTSLWRNWPNQVVESLMLVLYSQRPSGVFSLRRWKSGRIAFAFAHAWQMCNTIFDVEDSLYLPDENDGGYLVVCVSSPISLNNTILWFASPQLVDAIVAQRNECNSICSFK